MSRPAMMTRQPPSENATEPACVRDAPATAFRLSYLSHDLLAHHAVGDARAAVDELLDLLVDPQTEPEVRAAIQEWLNG